MIKYKYGRKAIICRGRLKGEKVTMIGETNLNMDYRITCYRENERARNKILGMHRCELKEV